MKCDYKRVLNIPCYKPANFKQNDDKGHRYIPPFYRRPPRLLPVPIAFNQCLPRRARPRRSILEGSKNRGRERGSPSLVSPFSLSPAAQRRIASPINADWSRSPPAVFLLGGDPVPARSSRPDALRLRSPDKSFQPSLLLALK